MANSCQKGWNGSTGNHKVTQDLTTKSTHGTRQLKRCCFHRIAEGSRPREVWADTSATARRYLGEWTNGKDQFCCRYPILMTPENGQPRDERCFPMPFLQGRSMLFGVREMDIMEMVTPKANKRAVETLRPISWKDSNIIHL